jgi:hypothetical protein
LVRPLNATDTYAYKYFSEGFDNGLPAPYTLNVPAHDLSLDSGFGLAIICVATELQPTGSCDGREFSVTLSELTLGWFNP